jgi:hypothetical protein
MEDAMKIAIVGSRDFDRFSLVVDYVNNLPKDTVVISGGARGVDRIATVAARNAGLLVIEYPADWENGGKGAGFARNTLIVEQADRVVAFWDGDSKGTLDTLKKAAAAGKLVEVWGSDGIHWRQKGGPIWLGARRDYEPLRRAHGRRA